MLPVLQHVLSGVSTGAPAPAGDWARPAPQAQAQAQVAQPRLVMQPAKQPVNAGTVDRARQVGAERVGDQGRPYAAGKNVGQWVEERRRERDARPARGPARDGVMRGAMEDRRMPLDPDKVAAAPQQHKDEWIEYQDPKTGRPYYYNKVTKKTEWQIPKRAAVAATAEPARLHLQQGRGGGGTRLAPERRVGFAAEEPTNTQDNAGTRLNFSRAPAATAAQTPFQLHTQATGATAGASTAGRLKCFPPVSFFTAKLRLAVPQYLTREASVCLLQCDKKLERAVLFASARWAASSCLHRGGWCARRIAFVCR